MSESGKPLTMITSTRDGNCISEDCIPFSQISTTSPELDPADEILDKENGKAPQLWITRRSGPPLFRITKAFWLRFLMVALFCTILLLVLFFCLWTTERHKLETPCLEPTCIMAAAEMLRNMDRTLSPCDNFYDYSCNGWIRRNHIPQGHNNWSILRKLTKNGEHFARELLENKTLKNPSRGLKLAQAYYNSCMNESVINHRGFGPLFEQLRTLFGGWILLPNSTGGARRDDGRFLTESQFNLTQFYLPWFLKSGTTPLFRVSVGQDLKNSSHFLVELNEGLISLNRENYVNETHSAYQKQTTEFRHFMRNYSLMLGVSPSDLTALDDVYSFEKQIAMRTEERSERDPEKNYELLTMTNLSIVCPVVDWHLLISRIFEPLNYTIAVNQVIALNDRDFFKSRCKLYLEYLRNESGIRVLHNTAIWQFLWHTVGKMPKAVSRAMEDYREAESGLKIDPERWQTCVLETQGTFGMVIGRMFVNERFDQKSKDAASEMISEIREAFKENFASVDWMQEEDKVKAIEKVDLMKASVGYPTNINDLTEEHRIYSHIENISVLTYLENSLICDRAIVLEQLNVLITNDKDRWELSPHIVNAFYKENANHIYFPAGILQSPVYNHEHPMSLNFGGIGMVVGHEITHAFDQYGAKRDAAGNLRQWWSNQTRLAFEHNSQCMIDQYSNYSILNTSLNGKMTLGENIADNGGIKAAYKAFKKLQAKYPDLPKLPGLNFTSDQLFFISFAQIWCVKNLPRSIMNTVLFDVHTVDQYRVIGTLSNSDEFARVFNCPAGSPMNPAKKCTVW